MQRHKSSSRIMAFLLSIMLILSLFPGEMMVVYAQDNENTVNSQKENLSDGDNKDKEQDAQPPAKDAEAENTEPGDGELNKEDPKEDLTKENPEDSKAGGIEPENTEPKNPTKEEAENKEPEDTPSKASRTKISAFSSPEDVSLKFAETSETEGYIYLDNIGSTVIEDITYSIEEGSEILEFNDSTRAVKLKNGYVFAGENDSGAEAIEFKVEATYYDDGDILFAETFEGAEQESEGGVFTGQQFEGTYARYASPNTLVGKPFVMPIVDDPSKARAGSKSVTQGAHGHQAEDIKAPLSGEAKEILKTTDAVAVMWYYDDGTNLNGTSQFGFGGGAYPAGWTTGAFSNMMGLYAPTAGGYSNYSYRYGTSNTWGAGPARSEGWKKFVWEIGESETSFSVNGTAYASKSNSLNRNNFSGFFIPFNWNNQSAPFNNKHFIDSFSVIRAGADVSEDIITDTVTVYAVKKDAGFELAKLTAEAVSATEIKVKIGDTKEKAEAEIAKMAATVEGFDSENYSVTFAASGEVDTSAENLALSVPGKFTVTLKSDPNDKAEDTSDKTITVRVTGDEDDIELYPDRGEELTPAPPLAGVDEREIIDINAGWRFGGRNNTSAELAGIGYGDTGAGWSSVNLPHDWNAVDGSDGSITKMDTASYWYRKTLTLTEQEAEDYNKRGAFLQFGAAGMEAEVYFNGEPAGSHMGGWSGFNIDISGKFVKGENLIAVRVWNTHPRDNNSYLAPLNGDFNSDGGLHREVFLTLTTPVHFDEVHYGSSGVYLSPLPSDTPKYNEKYTGDWQVDVHARVANDTQSTRTVTIKTTIKEPAKFDHSLDEYFPPESLKFNPDGMYDGNETEIGTYTKTVEIPYRAVRNVKFSIEDIADPTLWNGLNNPFQYEAIVDIYEGEDTTGALLDSYSTMIGFRYYDAVRKEGTTDTVKSYDPENGFYLNGEKYLLRGMAMHFDWPGLGRAVTEKYIATDIGVMYEMGASWIRMSHYQHPQISYEILSRYGIACSAEIPLVDGVQLTGSKTSGTLTPKFKESTLNQLRDLIKQNYNAPAILGWLMQNELGGGTYNQPSGGADSDVSKAYKEMITALNDEIHALDPIRKSVMAMSLDHCYRYDADWLLWNNYPGWYSTAVTGIGAFIDSKIDKDDGSAGASTKWRPTGASEYGAGTDPYAAGDTWPGQNSPLIDENGDLIAKQTISDPNNATTPHLEVFGNNRHEVSLREINARPFLWATGGWIMYDFAADTRAEGGRMGINDKGLVRKERPADVPGYLQSIADGTDNPSDLLLRKDVFYLHKANWNSEPLTYIANRRWIDRDVASAIVTVYSNADKVELFQNEKSLGVIEATTRTDGKNTGSCIFKFTGVTLTKGNNDFKAVGYDSSGAPLDWGGSDNNGTALNEARFRYGIEPDTNITSDVFSINNITKNISLISEGMAENIGTLIRPVKSDITLSYSITTSEGKPYSTGLIEPGMKLQVSDGKETVVYTFVSSYISANKTITLNGSSGGEISKAADGKTDTVWKALNTDAQEIIIDLGMQYVLNEISINWQNEGTASKYKVSISDDKSDWHAIIDRSENTISLGSSTDRIEGFGRYVKINIEAGSTPAISEIEVYGWAIAARAGAELVISQAARTIFVPTDIAKYHINGNIDVGMGPTEIGADIMVLGNCDTAWNTIDYTVQNGDDFVVTDKHGRALSFTIEFVTLSEGGADFTKAREISMGKPATCSGIQNDTMRAENATTPGTSRWNSSAYTGTDGNANEWIMVDMGAQCSLSSIKLVFPYNGGGGIGSDRYYNYKLQISSSANGPFETVVDKSQGTLDYTTAEGETFTSEVEGKSARYIRVVINKNSAGYQAGVNEIYVSGTTENTPVQPTVPTAPQNFTSVPGDGQVALSWEAPAQSGGKDINGYKVSSDGGATWVTASSDTGHTFTGLVNGKSYTFKVCAVNSVGEGEAAILTAAPQAAATVPTAPRNFTSVPGDGQVALSWEAPASNGGKDINGYKVSSDGGATWVTASSDTGHTFTGLANAKSYTFKVCAVNSVGEGEAAALTAAPIRYSSGGSGSDSTGSQTPDGMIIADARIPKVQLPYAPKWMEQDLSGNLSRIAKEQNKAYVRTSSTEIYGVRAANWSAFAGLRYEHDTVLNGRVQVRVYFPNPKEIKTDLMVSGSVSGAAVDRVRGMFEKYFTNKIRAVSFDQAGKWGQEVEAAVWIDLTGIDTNNLYFYSYNRLTNTYVLIANPRYKIDSNGYLHFYTEYAGDLIISQWPLTKK